MSNKIYSLPFTCLPLSLILSYQMHFPSLPETQEPTTTKNTAFLSFYEFFSTNLSPTKEVFVVQQKPYKKKKITNSMLCCACFPRSQWIRTRNIIASLIQSPIYVTSPLSALLYRQTAVEAYLILQKLYSTSYLITGY